MNDNPGDRGEGLNLSPIIGFALGAIVGSAVALLLAPASGERTRRRLGRAARRMSRDARHTFDDAREAVTGAASELGTDVKSAIDAGREAFRHDGEPRESRLVSRISHTPTPPPTRTP